MILNRRAPSLPPRSLGLRLFCHPLPWLLVQAVGVWWWLARTGALVAERVPDSSSYISLAENPTLHRILGSTRTFGYPLFLKVVGSFSPKYEAAPGAQLLIFLAMVLLFWFGVSRYTASPWLAFGAAIPLFYAPIMSLVGRIQADFLAAALALASVALLFLLAERPRVTSLWALVTVAVAVTYHVRPAYLYLMPLVPVLGLGLRWLRPEERRLRWCWGAGLALAAVLPFLAYSGMRSVVVGHFGLVSFGGYNSTGISTGMLDEELIAELPFANRSLAAAILAKRREVGLEQVTAESPIRRWHDRFNPYVWTVALPAARGFWRELRAEAEVRGGARDLLLDRKEVWLNRELSALSKEVLRRRPGLYAKWVVGGFVVGLAKTWAMPWVRWPALLLLLGLAVLGGRTLLHRTLLHRTLLHRRRLGSADARSGSLEAASATSGPWRSAAVLLAGVSFFLAALLLVVIIEVPFDRYVLAMVLLLPSALCAALTEVGSRFLGAGGGSR